MSFSKYLLVPGGPGLPTFTMEGVGECLGGAEYLSYDSVQATGNSEDSLNGLVESGFAIASGILSAGNIPVLVGHSFGGLVAKEISSRLPQSVTILISTPVSKGCYSSALKSYEKLASQETLDAYKAYTLNRNDKTLTDWLSSYGQLYFSTSFLIKGRTQLSTHLSS